MSIHVVDYVVVGVMIWDRETIKKLGGIEDLEDWLDNHRTEAITGGEGLW